MKALIQGNKIPQTIDCSIAFHGFEELEYEIEVIQNWLHLNKLELQQYNICVASVNICRHTLLKLGVKNFDILSYPEKLSIFLERTVKEAEIIDIVRHYPKGKFVKPIKPKRFNGFLTSENTSLQHLIDLDDHEKIYIVDPVDFVSEWRVYVRKKQIEAICFYKGIPTLFPNVVTIKKMIEMWDDSPCCYALDVGIVSPQKTLLVEVNDFYSLGNYGLDHITYANMLQMRWNELLSLT